MSLYFCVHNAVTSVFAVAVFLWIQCRHLRACCRCISVDTMQTPPCLLSLYFCRCNADTSVLAVAVFLWNADTLLAVAVFLWIQCRHLRACCRCIFVDRMQTPPCLLLLYFCVADTSVLAAAVFLCAQCRHLRAWCRCISVYTMQTSPCLLSLYFCDPMQTYPCLPTLYFCGHNAN